MRRLDGAGVTELAILLDMSKSPTYHCPATLQQKDSSSKR